MSTRKAVPVAARAKGAIAHLKKLGDPKTLAGYARYGITVKRGFGMSMKEIQTLAKRLGKDHALADALWRSGWYEARLLAAYVADPAKVTPAQMERWVKGFDNWGIVDTVCFVCWDKTPHRWTKIAAWCRRPEEFVRRTGFALIASVALHDKEESEGRFLRVLPLIEQYGADERNFVKKGASWALRSIARRGPKLRQGSLAVAGRMAKSESAGARWVGRDVLRELKRRG